MIACTIDHLHLRSPDPRAAAAFYADVFGATIRGEVMDGPALRMIVDCGGLTLFIEEVPGDTPRPPAPPFVGYEHIGLTVKDIAAAMDEIKRRGIPVVMDVKVLSPVLTIAFIEGPDGVRIELLQRS